MRVSFGRTQHLCFLVSGVINPHPSCPVGHDTRLATARSRSRSDNALRCHSLRSRRFATPRGRREGIGLLKYHLLFRYRGSIWNAPLRQSLRHAYGVPPPFTQGRLWVVRDLSAADNPCRGRPPGRPEISPILPISRAFTERPYGAPSHPLRGSSPGGRAFPRPPPHGGGGGEADGEGVLPALFGERRIATPRAACRVPPLWNFDVFVTFDREKMLQT